MSDSSAHAADSPFATAHRLAFEFALNMQEDVVFRKLYEVPSTREDALEYMITNPKIKYQKPN